jgi:hypothetical protein
MSWSEQVCRWSLAYGFVDWHWRYSWRTPAGWKSALHDYARALGLDPEEGR